MKLRKLTALFMSAMMAATMMTGFTASADEGEYSDDEIVTYTMFATMAGSELNDDNEIMNIIAHKLGVKVKETWLTGQTAEEAIGTIIASGDYPDFIDGGDGSKTLYEQDVLVPWDDYLEKYPNLKEMYTDEEWDQFRQDDGHIYWANVFQNTYGEPKTTMHNDEAFWIQARVLEWAGYPEIKTLDQYFDLLESYYEANPTMEDGTPIIPYTVLCEDWKYYCIENAPQFLDGYPNDGSVIVDKTDPSAPKIVDYNTTETAVRYFKKLNEEYAKGMIDGEFATQTYDEYIAKLCTGTVLGLCDQWWDFGYDTNDSFKTQGLDLIGCNYVPLGLTIDEGMDNRWHTYGDTLNVASGVAVTTSCDDPDRAFKFLNDVLDQEIHDLRFWGVEGVDYLVDEDGMYYRTEEMRMQAADSNYQASHLCQYSYLPQWGGTSRDGKNAMMPSDQASEFLDGLAEPLRNCLEAYGAGGYPDMIGSVIEENPPWFPMWSFSNNLSTETPGGVAWTKMREVKQEWLPQVVMSDDFEGTWEQYMEAYNAVNPQDFLDEMQEELNRRAGIE